MHDKSESSCLALLDGSLVLVDGYLCLRAVVRKENYFLNTDTVSKNW
jgi:hypothetical protein